ncbi:uncharacterized protein DNG_01786 [Cephalotrichum gorgonifer]|uniref:6-phosphogluconolactonase n=1 Tax=Cephalotrichum gorgonifer TaxID=2041049 RepID=A0AAE8MSD6_9PEZI|nr:uncharacterized protein DNG_01786 [Cephalotrichum gorgonifer]
MPHQSLTRALLLALLPTALSSSIIVSHFEGTVYSLALSDDASELSVSSQVQLGGMPSWVTLDKETKTLYVTDESWFGSTKLSAWSVGEGAALTAAGQAPTRGGELHCSLFGGADGKGFIAASQYGGGSIITYSLPLTPSSTPLDTLKFTMSGPGPRPDRQDAPHPHSTLSDPTGGYLLVPDLGADLVRIFAISASGKLTACPAAAAPPGSGPRHAAFWGPADATADTDITILYTVNEIANSVTSWDVSYDSDCLTLTQKDTVSTFPAGETPRSGSKAAEILVRDNFIYVSNRWDKTFGQTSDSIALFNITSPQGDFEFVELADSGANFPRTMDLNAKGDMLAVGGQTSSDVVVLERDVETGRLGGVLAKLQVGRLGREGEEDGLSGIAWSE